MNDLITLQLNDFDLMPTDPTRDQRTRIGIYQDWLQSTNRPWYSPNLTDYRDYLLDEYTSRYGAYAGQTLSPRSVAAHLSTIRGRYQAILKDNRFRDMLYQMTPDSAAPSDKKALVDEALQRLQNAIDPDVAKVEVITQQDRPDAETLRLTSDQASRLLAAPGVDTLMGLRDTALIALMLCTGVREAELIALDVKDLRQHLGGELALHIRRGKGAKERLIPYGSLDFCLTILDSWLTFAGIESGAVFRGFYKGGKRVRSGRLHVRAVNQIMEKYPVVIAGRSTLVHPHDLRRTYARRLYEAGVDVVAIQQNLGHADLKTTLHYIGELNADKRKPPAVYNFDIGKLRKTSI